MAHGLGVCSKIAPVGRPLSHLRNFSAEPPVLTHGLGRRDTGGWFQAPKMDGIPPSHPVMIQSWYVMVMFYGDPMAIKQWIFRENLLTKPQRPQKTPGEKFNRRCASKSLGFQRDLKHLIPVLACDYEAFASGDFLDASWRNVRTLLFLEETTSNPLHLEKVCTTSLEDL